MGQLRSSDPSVRGAAKLELIKSASPEALPILLKEIPLTLGQTRTTMLEVLAVYKDPKKIPVLMAIALAVGGNTGDADVETQLSELGAPAARALMDSLEKNCDASDAGGYTSWVGNTLASMKTGAFPVFVGALRHGNGCQQSAAEEGLQRAYAEPEQGLNDSTINLFIKAVESEDPVIHAAASKWIDSFDGNVERMEFDGIIEVLIAAYRTNAPPSTMQTIADLLAGVTTPRVSRFMRAAVHAPNPEIQHIARDYLMMLHETSAVPISNGSDADAEALRSLHSPDPAKRIEAATILSRADDAVKTTPILVKAMRDPDAKVRAAVAAALGDLNGYSSDLRNERERDVSCASALAEALKDSEPLVRAAAAHSLGQIRDYDATASQALGVALKDGDETVVIEAANTIAGRPDPAAAPMLEETFHTEHKDPHVKSSALSALAAICNPSSQAVFIEALDIAGAYEQNQAALGLECTLKKQRNPGAVEPLLKLLATRPTYSVIQASGETKDPRAYESLVRILNASDRDVRRWGVDALGELGDKRAIVPLSVMLKDANSSVRAGAAHALSKMSDYQPPKELLDAVHDEDTGVQIEAASALGNSHDPKAVDVLLAAASYNVAAIRALGQSRNVSVVAPLILMLQDKSRKTADRQAAAYSLGDLGDIRAVDPLIGVLKENDAQLLMSAAQALGKLHDKKAIEPLKQLIARWESLPSGQQGTGAVATFAYAALRELGVDNSRRVTGNPPRP